MSRPWKYIPSLLGAFLVFLFLLAWLYWIVRLSMTTAAEIDEQLDDRFRHSEGADLGGNKSNGPQVSAQSNGSSALIIKIGQDAEKLIAAVISKLSMSAWFNAFAGLALLWMGWHSYCQSRESRMLEYYVMELDGKVMQAGIIKPEESWSHHKRCQETECLPNGKTIGEAVAEHYEEKSK